MVERNWRVRLATIWILAIVSALLWACSGPSTAPPGGAATAPPAAAAKPGTASGANPGAPPAAAQATPTAGPLHHIDLGVVALVSYFYPMWIAIEQGFNAQQGLDVEMTTLQTNEAVAAAVSGSLDILMCPTDSCITAISKGAQLVQVNDYMVQAPYDLIARPEIQSVSDLRGKRVGASSLSAGTGTLAKIMLRARGLAPDDYQLVQAGGNPARFAALQSGGVDAAMLSDPVNFQAVLEGYRNLLNFSEVVPEYSFSSDWVQDSWLQDVPNRDYLVSFQAAQIKANQWAQDPANKAAFIDLIVRQTRTTPAVAERVHDFYIVQNPNIVGVDGLRQVPTQTVVSILQEWEGLPALPPESEWRNDTYIQRARQVAAR
jgi:ABC-type nitrate/sulfonate/bicarbonate transport system substrate-binding protein